MEIHFAECPDLNSGTTVLMAYTMVGPRKIMSKLYISQENYRQNYIDFAYQQLKDEVRRRALSEMRVQQHHEGARNREFRLDNFTPPRVRAPYPDIREVFKTKERTTEKVNWLKEGF